MSSNLLLSWFFSFVLNCRFSVSPVIILSVVGKHTMGFAAYLTSGIKVEKSMANKNGFQTSDRFKPLKWFDLADGETGNT
jgi:hypothetical protein